MLIRKVDSARSARQDFFKILDEVAQDNSVIIVNRKDGPNVAFIAESELNSLLETVHLLRSPENAKRLFSAIEKSRVRDLESPEPDSSTPASAATKVLQSLRRYCSSEHNA